MPLTCVSLEGSFSRTSRVWSPKTSTIRPASPGPMPFTAPEARYFRIAAAVSGRLRSNSATLNWYPNFGWVAYCPVRTSASPGTTPCKGPTAGRYSSPVSISTTANPVEASS